MKKTVLLYDFLLTEGGLALGGLERVMQAQGKILKNNYKVIASFGAVGKNVSDFFDPAVELHEHSFPLKFTILKIISTFLNRRSLSKLKNVSLFISHSFICTKLAYNMKKRFKIPYTVFLHHPPNFLYLSKNSIYWGDSLGRIIALAVGIILGPILRSIDKKVVSNADVVFVNSNFTGKRAKKIYGINPIVVYPTINDKFKIVNENLEETKLKYNLKSKFILCSGRLVPDKKYDFLVDAFSKLKNFDLILTGRISKSYKRKLETLATNKGCLDRIKFIGFVDDNHLVNLYNLASVFAFPAPKEDFGLVPVESIACGTPVVAWGDNAGPSESITHGISGYLAKPYNIRDFADKILLASQLTDKSKISKTANKFKENEQLKIFNNYINKLL